MSRPEYGDTWVYEGIIGAIPGLELGLRRALAVQFLGFEAAVLVLAWYYDLTSAAVVGTVAVAVTTIGSAHMVAIAQNLRDDRLPEPYRRLLFGSNIATVLGVFTFVGLVTYLFVFDPARTELSLLEELFGADPPVLVVALALLILWDVCYRISAGWWAGITALWRSLRYQFDSELDRTLRRADRRTALFGLTQLAFVPFLLEHPILLAALVGHVVAVVLVTTSALALLKKRETDTVLS